MSSSKTYELTLDDIIRCVESRYNRQALTDTLRAAADALSAANIRHESRNSEHLLALLNGLRGTSKRRDPFKCHVDMMLSER